MKHVLKLLIAAFILQNIASCTIIDQLNSNKVHALEPVDYLERAPRIDVKNFFNGDLEAFAIIKNAEGKIENSFVAKINGKWEENRGTVHYSYVYNSGKKDSRTWLITINDQTSYSAIGHDFIETAQGRNQGNGSVVNYSLNTIFKEIKQRIDYEDKLYLVDEKSAIIVSTMKSSNKVVGQAIISLKKN